MNEALVVIGMHRSGTSATTGALQCLQVDLGRRLYAGHDGINPKGYFEHSDIADTNDRALACIDSFWDDVLPRVGDAWQRPGLAPYRGQLVDILRRDFARSRMWAVKDPRVCRMLPWWHSILAEAGHRVHHVFIVRSPLAVARSLQRRDGFSLDKGCLLWLRHYLEAEAATIGLGRVFIAFDDLVAAPVDTLERVERSLGIVFPVSPADASVALKKFVSGDLQHHRGEAPCSATSAIVQLALDLERALRRACETGAGGPDAAAIDEVQRRLAAIEQAWEPVLVEQLRHLNKVGASAGLSIHRILHSWSWPVGRPVRALERLLGRDI
jgi:hypothetical protein